ncbi:MAG TPA: outer membrane protein transport protein [Kofleriaceae bacterium]|nr:outer membrane protein transport protein [Kofleriaceae bacterium]
MQLRWVVIGTGLLFAIPAQAGGLFVPGSGAVSSSRAGAAVASVDDGEALSINPAGIAKAKGLQVTVAATLIQYYMSFARRGTYDDPVVAGDMRPYTGQSYGVVENDPKPPLGIGKFQPLPVIAVTSDLGGRVPGLTIGGGLYTPSGYPFRDMSQGYKFQTSATGDFSVAPPPTRYDVMEQDSALLLPSIAAAYRIMPDLDVGVRLTAGNLKSKTTVAVWGTPYNTAEDVKDDALFTADVKDGFIPAAGIGATYRVGPNIELGAVYNSPIVIKAKGTAQSLVGPSVDPSRKIGNVPDSEALCEKGGTMEQQRACISLQLPMTATIGGRYKILDEKNELMADVELDVNWENWGKTCNFDDTHIVNSTCTAPGQYRVQIDAGLYTNGNYTGQKIADATEGTNVLKLGLQDTFGVRLGGSYHLPAGDNKIVLRGGLAYDTAAAKTGWLRANFDGASRVTTAVGGAYEVNGWQINAGFGYVYEGTNTNPGANADGTDCNPTPAMLGCSAAGDRPPGQRQGPDPTNPLLTPNTQGENPINQGSITSHYLMFMLGFSKGF